MTGIFKPDRKSLNPADLAAWRFFYCSLCDTLRREYSAGAAFLLPSDIVWLLLCLDNRQSVVSAGCPGTCRCLANPFKHRRTIGPHPLFSAAADLSAFVIRLKIIDDRIDDRIESRRKLATRCRRWMMRCIANWARTGENRLQIADDEIAAILATDNHGEALPDERIRLLKDWLTGVFEKRLAKVPGVRIDGSLRTIIAETIRILYLVDALEDFHADRRSDRSNILSCFPVPLRRMPACVAAMVHDSAARIRTALVPGPRSPILENILRHVTCDRLALACRRFETGLLDNHPQEILTHENITTGLLCHSWSHPERLAGGHQTPLPGTGPAIPPGPAQR